MTASSPPLIPPLILASSSPRRLELLRRLGLEPAEIVPADIDETPLPGELPAVYARRMSAGKAAAVVRPGTVLVAADVVVAAGRRILPKAETEEEGRACLALLSGRRHRVLAAVTVVDPAGKARHRLSESVVTFNRLSDEETEAYIASDEWRGTAGGYAIQGRAEALVRGLQGSFSGIMGLPLYETRALLKASGLPVG